MSGTIYQGILNAPPLDLDKVLYKNEGRVPPHVIRERRVVWNLLKHLYSDGGWMPCFVYDGDGYTAVSTPKEAMELIFQFDEAKVYFARNKRNQRHSIYLVLGNDLDVLSDWSWPVGDPEGFNAVLEKFNAEDFA